MSHPEIKDITINEIKRVLQNREIDISSGMKKLELYNLMISDDKQKKESIMEAHSFKRLTIAKIKKLLKSLDIEFKSTMIKTQLYDLLQPKLYKLIPFRYIRSEDIDEMYLFMFKKISQDNDKKKLRKINTKLQKYDIRYVQRPKICLKKPVYPPFNKINETDIYTISELKEILLCFDNESKTDKSRNMLIEEINEYYSDRYVKKLVAGSTLTNDISLFNSKDIIYYGNRRFYKAVSRSSVIENS